MFSPGEPEETYERYLEFIPRLVHLPPPLAVYPVEFVRYSPWFDGAEEAGLDLAPEPYYGLTYPWPTEPVLRIAQKFRDRNADLRAMRQWLERLNEKISWWQSRWYNRDGRTPARLCLATDGRETAVFDSRSGEPFEHPLTPDLEKVLAVLEHPQRRSALRENPGLDGIDTDAAIEFFLERHLLFCENGRFMSLVAG